MKVLNLVFIMMLQSFRRFVRPENLPASVPILASLINVILINFHRMIRLGSSGDER
jgi:hypothetical protein